LVAQNPGFQFEPPSWGTLLPSAVTEGLPLVPALKSVGGAGVLPWEAQADACGHRTAGIGS